MGRKRKNNTSELSNSNDEGKTEKITVESEGKVCVLCKKGTVDEIKYGPLYTNGDMVCHHFCLLFCSNLAQNGEDEDGILGFLVEDIRKALGRIRWSGFKCIYCGERGASIGCCVGKCKGIWHFPCGLKAGVNYQFFDTYESFCPTHTTLPGRLQRQLKRRRSACPICLTDFGRLDRVVVGSCCKSSIFHKQCIQEFAVNSGYFFKCPTCASSEKFKRDVERQGIYVPEKDASWELEPNAYEGLNQRYSHCDAATCKCPKGRDHNDDDGPWFLARCRLCAASGTHMKCSSVDEDSRGSWICGQCQSVSVKKASEINSSKCDVV